MTGLCEHAAITGIDAYVPGESQLNYPGEVLKLSANENPRGCSVKALEAAAAALQRLHRYPDGGAYALRAAIEHVVGFKASQVVCGAGSDDVLALAVQAYAAPGDEVLCSEHGFALYPVLARSAGALPVAVPESALTANVAELLASVTPRTKVVFLANPNNPTGTYLTRTELARLHAGLPGNVLLVVDGAYAEYADAPDFCDGRSLIADGAGNVLLTRTFSKVYGLAALRVGYAYAAPAVADVLNKIRGPFNVNSIGAAAAIAALHDTAYTAACVAETLSERERLRAALAAAGYKSLPSQGNFLCVHFGERVDEVDNRLRSRGILVRRLKAYKMPEYLRITVGTPEQNTRLLNALVGSDKGVNR